MILWILVLVPLAAVLAWWWVGSNVETPDYEVVSKEGPLELRRYPELVAAEVERRGGRFEAVRRGFGPLAGYIFAKERSGEKIAMTAPVTQQRAIDYAGDADPVGAEGAWKVRFIMPSAREIESLPEPERDDVRLVRIPAQRVAAIRFGGVATDPLIEANQAKLLEWVASQGLQPTEPPTYAYYDDPFTPGFLRRNEVLVAVAPQTPDDETAARER